MYFVTIFLSFSLINLAFTAHLLSFHPYLANHHSVQYPPTLSSLNDNFYHRTLPEQQIAEIMEALVIINVAQYLHGLYKALQTASIDGQDGGAVFQDQ